jgi:hypothetical protein
MKLNVLFEEEDLSDVHDTFEVFAVYARKHGYDTNVTGNSKDNISAGIHCMKEVRIKNLPYICVLGTLFYEGTWLAVEGIIHDYSQLDDPNEKAKKFNGGTPTDSGDAAKLFKRLMTAVDRYVEEQNEA